MHRAIYRPEVVPSRLSNITLYLQALAVPARRNVNDPEVERGEALFAQAQCSVCHVPELKTGPKPALPAAANLTIRPYTDLLLHDMGEELADGRPDFKASGREWRTPPLWGIGLLRDRQRAQRSAARRPRAQRHRGDPLARRPGGDSRAKPSARCRRPIARRW